MTILRPSNCKLSEGWKVSARRREKEPSSRSSCSSYANTKKTEEDPDPGTGSNPDPPRRDGDGEETSDARSRFRRNPSRIRYDPTRNPWVSRLLPEAGRESLLRRNGCGDDR